MSAARCWCYPGQGARGAGCGGHAHALPERPADRPPSRVTVYYQGITDPTHAVPFPFGLKIIDGNSMATSPQNPAARWSCLGYAPASSGFPTCPAGSSLQTYLDFPTCWDGIHLDSPNHHDHMAYAVAGACPTGYPVVVPRLELLITYPVNGGGL